jgi:hypothetical protein
MPVRNGDIVGEAGWRRDRVRHSRHSTRSRFTNRRLGVVQPSVLAEARVQLRPDHAPEFEGRSSFWHSVATRPRVASRAASSDDRVPTAPVPLPFSRPTNPPRALRLPASLRLPSESPRTPARKTLESALSSKRQAASCQATRTALPVPALADRVAGGTRRDPWASASRVVRVLEKPMAKSHRGAPLGGGFTVFGAVSWDERQCSPPGAIAGPGVGRRHRRHGAQAQGAANGP